MHTTCTDTAAMPEHIFLPIYEIISSCCTVLYSIVQFYDAVFELIFFILFFIWEIMVRPWPYWPHRFLRPCIPITTAWQDTRRFIERRVISMNIISSIDLFPSTCVMFSMSSEYIYSFMCWVISFTFMLFNSIQFNCFTPDSTQS